MSKSDVVMILFLVISIVGWLKSEKFPKIASYLIIALMCLLVGYQIYESHVLGAILQNTQKNLQQKEQQIVELGKKAEQAERGIVDVFDFSGRRRINSPGKMSTKSATKEVIAFQEMVQLHDEKKYEELIILCHQQIPQNPEWLTPYFFLGIAYGNTGDKGKARIQFEYVLEKAAEDPAYKDAEKFLQQLGK